MTYLEYSLEMDKLDLKFELSIGNALVDQIYQESVSSFFNKLINAISSYITDVKNLYKLYKDKKDIDKGFKYLENLCNKKVFANQVIYIRGYNGKLISSLSLDDDIKAIKNLITYTKTKINNPLISGYLERHELYKAGWDTFYKLKIKEVPSFYNDINKKLDSAIDELKSSLKDLSSYFENADDTKHSSNNKNIFKKIIQKIKESIKRDISIISMNIEAIQYEVGKTFSKLTNDTSLKVVKKDISDEDIIKDSKFVKEIKYGDTIYKIYTTNYNNISAMNYGGSLIYVENKFFDLPKGYQLAILYHEIGHNQCKHFKPVDFKANKINDNIDIPIEDTEKIVKQIKKDLNKFLYRLSNSKFKEQEKYVNGEEFIYLLVEWEADRFSSNIVGKRLIRKALTSHFSDNLKNKPYYKDKKKQEDHYKYNMDRMKLRTKNI